jgi:hypothetical protein
MTKAFEMFLLVLGLLLALAAVTNPSCGPTDVDTRSTAPRVTKVEKSKVAAAPTPAPTPPSAS